MPKTYSFWQKLNEWPPCLVRLYAHKGANALSNAELSIISGIPAYEIAALSMRRTWDAIPVGVVKSFTSACGVDFCDPDSMERLRIYFKNGPKFRHLKRLPDDERDFFRDLVRYTAGHLK